MATMTENHRVRTTGQHRSLRLIRMSLAVFLLFMPCPAFLSAENLAEEVSKCAQIKDNAAKRLQCFDELANRTGQPPSFTQPPATETKTAGEGLRKNEVGPSILSRQWDLEKVKPKDTFRLRLYRTNYFLPFTYNSSPNRSTGLDVDPNARAQNVEAEFQLSLKMKIWQELFRKNVDLWFAYTQRSFWQVYNSDFSAPFRETDYEPELFFTIRTDYPFLGLRGRLINIGLNHQSNGRSEPLSRSWNRIVGTAGFERNGFNLFLKAWYRFPESSQSDDNPDIHRYMGYGELRGLYYWKRHRFGAMLRNNLQSHNNKGAFQVDWAFPLPFVQMQQFSGFIQYFNGYGESLLDYNKSTNRIGFGFMLTDW